MARAFRFTEKAEKDVDAILSYTLTAWGEAQAQAYILGLYDLLDIVSENPAAGRLRPELAPGLRSFPIGSTSSSMCPLKERSWLSGYSERGRRSNPAASSGEIGTKRPLAH